MTNEHTASRDHFRFVLEHDATLGPLVACHVPNDRIGRGSKFRASDTRLAVVADRDTLRKVDSFSFNFHSCWKRYATSDTMLVLCF